MKRTAACLLALAAATVSADGFKEGQWELTTQMSMPGMPQMPTLPPGVQLPPGMKLPGVGASGIVTKQCLKRDQAIPKSSGREDMKCETTKQQFSGGTLEWEARCTDSEGGVVISQGKGTYSGDTMTSQMHTTGTAHGHPMDVTMNTTGKYLGPCPAQ